MAIYITIDEDQNVVSHSSAPADHIAAVQGGNWSGSIIQIDVNTGLTEYVYDCDSEEYRWLPVTSADEPL